MIYTINNIKIHVGIDAASNWSLLDKNPSYIWMHLKSFPSCYVIIESDCPGETVLYESALLCKKHTKYRNVPNLYVIYTHCNNLIKGKEIGTVIIKSKRKVNKIKV